MIKRFFISMLGTIAGLWISIILLIICSIVCVGVLIGKSFASSTPSLSNQSILKIDLSGAILEKDVEITVKDVLNGDLSSENLYNIVTSIRLASSDKKIKGIFIDCKGSDLGIASRSEIIDALEDFKESGKWIYAYSDNYTQGDYYVASIADKIFLNPVGSLDVHGLQSTTLFFKNLLDKLGVEMQVVKVGSYKSAVEPYIRTDMSEPSRHQTTVFLDEIWNGVSERMASNRGLNRGDVNMWADSLSFTWAPERYVENNIVNELNYRSQVEDMMRTKLGVKKDKEMPYISPNEYITLSSSKLVMPSKKHIAVLYAVGDIVDSGEGGIVSDKIVPQIQALAENDKVLGLVLRVNSGGGSAFASEQIWNALEDFKKTGKPFYVSMGDYAASGGYYISCGADKIYADPATLTGSIGIFGLIPNAEKLITDKIGINVATVETNPNASLPVLFKGMDARQYAAMQGYVERGYATFVDRVSKGRDLTPDSVMAIGGGRVWDGVTATNIGLVDELANLYEVIGDMAETLDIDANNYCNYPSIEENWLNLILNSGQIMAEENPVNQFLKYSHYLNAIKDISPVQARMETIIIE